MSSSTNLEHLLSTSTAEAHAGAARAIRSAGDNIRTSRLSGDSPITEAALLAAWLDGLETGAAIVDSLAVASREAAAKSGAQHTG